MELIYSYTRKQAIEDGVIVEVSQELSREAGFVIPVAVTAKLYHEWIVPTETDLKYGQSIDGRLWDILHLLRFYSSRTTGDTVYYCCYFLKNKKQRKVRLKAVVHPDDDMNPVITIMLDNED